MISAEWVAIAALVRAFFVVVPLVDMGKHFAFANDDQRREAKEFATVTASKASLCTLPGVFAVAVWAQADASCSTAGPRVAALVFITIALIALVYFVPNRRLRGGAFAILLVGFCTIIDLLLQFVALQPAAALLCK